MNYAELSRVAGGTERKEYRPKVKLTGTGKQYIKVSLGEDVDLTKDAFAIQAIQGGNRVGTDRNKAMKKVAVSGTFEYKFADKADKFNKVWSGEGVSAGSWDEGGDGNQKIFTNKDGKLIPRGDYVLEFTPTWKTKDAQWNLLKEVTIRVLTHSKVDKLSVLTKAQAADTLTGGKTELSHDGKNCMVGGDANLLGKKLSLAQASAAAVKKGFTDFTWSESYSESYGCSKDWCPSNDFAGEYSAYHIKGSKSSMKSVCDDAPIGGGGAAPGGAGADTTPKTADDALKSLTALIKKEEGFVQGDASDKTLY